MQKMERKVRNCLALGWILIGMFMITSCAGTRVVVDHSPDRPNRHEGGYEHPEHRTGPPPWAPAHGYRAKKYRYYPSVQVYFDIQRDVYFYYRNREWRVSARLPNRIRTSMAKYITLEMGTDQPYKYHSEVVEQYPPGLSRGRGNDRGRTNRGWE